MVNCLVVTYGSLAKEMVAIAEKITGKKDIVDFLQFSSDPSVEDLKNQIENKIQSFKSHEKVLVLIDIFGSPHSKILISFKKKIRLVSGVNLPMVIAAHKAIVQGETSVDNMVKEIQRQTFESIIDFHEAP